MNGTARNLKPVKTGSYSANIERWAIIVGISKYKDESLNLKYADRDAEELYKLLLSSVGGGFEEDHIKKLINEEATTAEITKALRSFVQNASKDDICMLYFACHGSPDPYRPKNIYLLTHDTDRKNIAGTALPMREIDQSLKENLYADRVIIIADTCHSAAIGGDICRSADDGAQAVNIYLQEVSKSRGGVALLTSAEANESSLEGEQWGEGHGVFTHFLLQGMRGDADGYGQTKDGIVTVGELFDYVREKVRKETNHKQHPLIGSNSFDRNLPMAITGEINIQEHYKLGLGLYELGWMLDDTKRFQAAADQFREAISLSRLAKMPHSEAEQGLGKALAASGDYEEANKVLSRLIERDCTKSSPEALIYLGITQAKQKDYSAAESTFEKFLAYYPEDSNAPWVKEYREWLNRKKNSRKYALFIGINEYKLKEITFSDNSCYLPNLHGCLNDVKYLKKVLIQRCGFEEINVFTLLDQDATYLGILGAFNFLSQKVTDVDTVIVYYSGHSLLENHLDSLKDKDNSDFYLIAHDTKFKSGGLFYLISSLELLNLMRKIPTMNKTLILDTSHGSSSQLNELVKAQGFVLLTASSPGEFSYESFKEVDGEFVSIDIFTSILIQILEESDPETLTYGELLNSALAKIKMKNSYQTPLFIGDRDQLVFDEDIEDIYLKIFKFAQRRNYTSMESESINMLYNMYREHTNTQPALMHYSFGLAFLERSNYDDAIDALHTALQLRNGNCPEAFLTLGTAQIRARRDSEAMTSFQQYATVAPEEMATLARQLIERTEKLVSNRKHALLVGINDYLDISVTRVKGALNDVQALKEVLLTKFGFKEKDITVLLNSDATRAAIIDAFKQLVEKAREEPAIFYFAGNGSFNITDHEPTIVSADGRLEMVYDIEIKELVELAANNTSHLVTIIDAGWMSYQEDDKDHRTISADTRERLATRNIVLSKYKEKKKPRKLDQDKLRIGFLSIYAHSIRDSCATAAKKSESEFTVTTPVCKGKFFGILTRGLIQSLEEVDLETLTYSQWLVSVSKQIWPLAPVIVGDHSNEFVFDSRTMRSEVLKLVNKIEQKPVFETIMLLRRMIEQHEQNGNPYPEGWLNLGVAYSVVGDYDKSIDTLGRAVDLYTDMKINAKEKEKDPNAECHYHDAHYQLGRVLFESENDFSRAMSELEKATKLDQENARAYYYLGQVIRVMVERETLAKAELALKKYLEKGAPLGHINEVQKFLKSRIKDTSVENEGKVASVSNLVQSQNDVLHCAVSLYAVTVMKVDPDAMQVLLNAGQAHGIKKGAQFAIYPPNTVDFTQLDKRLAVAEIYLVGAVYSWAEFLMLKSNTTIEQGAQAVFIDPGSVQLVKTVYLVKRDDLPPELDQSEIMEKFKNVLTDAKWVEMATNDGITDYQVAVNDKSEFEIWDRVGQPFTNLRPTLKINDSQSATRMVQRLIHLARYHAIGQIFNYDSRSPLAGKLVVELIGVQKDYNPADLLQPEPFENSGDIPTIKVGEWTFLRVKNNLTPGHENDPSQILNVTVFDMQPDWGISQIHPTGKEFFEPLKPGQGIILPFRANLPAGYKEGKDVIKVFATLEPTSFRWLELPPLDKPTLTRNITAPNGQINTIEKSSASINLEIPATCVDIPDYPSKEWVTAQVEIRILQS